MRYLPNGHVDAAFGANGITAVSFPHLYEPARDGDQRVQSNFVELRRLTSELADVDGALAQAEEAWLTLSERAPR